jgi:hypothetical protein
MLSEMFPIVITPRGDSDGMPSVGAIVDVGSILLLVEVARDVLPLLLNEELDLLDTVGVAVTIRTVCVAVTALDLPEHGVYNDVLFEIVACEQCEEKRQA